MFILSMIETLDRKMSLLNLNKIMQNGIYRYIFTRARYYCSPKHVFDVVYVFKFMHAMYAYLYIDLYKYSLICLCIVSVWRLICIDQWPSSCFALALCLHLSNVIQCVMFGLVWFFILYSYSMLYIFVKKKSCVVIFFFNVICLHGLT